MKFIMINGASCSGKSTIVKMILAEKARYYKVSYDALKWGFSQYEPNEHFEDVRTLVRTLTEALCTMNYNIVCDSGMHKETREKLFEIAKRHDYEIVEINLDADYTILEERFKERLARAETMPSVRMANKDTKRHRELFDIYESEKNFQAITFRTDKQNEDEVFKSLSPLL